MNNVTNDCCAGNFTVFLDGSGQKHAVPRGRAIVRSDFDSDPPNAMPSRELAVLQDLNPFSDPLLHDVFVMGTSYHALGDAEGIPASTILRRVRKRLQQLREKLDNRLTRDCDSETDNPDNGMAGSVTRTLPKRPSDNGAARAVAMA